MGNNCRFCKVVLIAVIIMAIAGFAVGPFVVPKAMNYISENPLMCAGCHIMEPAVVEFVKSTHYGKAKCVDCHKDTFAGKMRRIGKTVFLDPQFVSREAEVSREKCVKCHQNRQDHMTDKCGICHTPSGIPHRWTVPHK